MPAVVADLTHADKELRLALGRFFDTWSRRIASHAPDTAAATAHERALATIALCVGGLTIARSLRGQPLSDEFLRACRTWALPERRRTSKRPPPARRRRARR